MVEQVDVLVIGAGIHGAGVAQAAAAQGYSVLVLEKGIVASGTSSRSSKLIHGGLRYLETGQFSLVRECLHERSILLKIAPQLVHLKPFYFPLFASSTRRSWQLRAGLSLYSLAAGLSRQTRFSTIDKSCWQDLDGLNTQGLNSVYCYPDAQTDDVELTRAVMFSAITMGAKLIVQAEMLKAELYNAGSRSNSGSNSRSSNATSGCEVHYRHQGKQHTVQAKVLVNAAGPWVNLILKRITPKVECLNVELVQGTHIVVEGKLSRGIYYLESPIDQRVVFVMPWKGKILIGTTESIYVGDPGLVSPLPNEIDYLLQVLKHYFPIYQRQAPQIIEKFSGLRVLPKSDGSPFRRARGTQLLRDNKRNPQLITIYGGKLTAYRAVADQVLQCLRPSLPAPKVKLDTAKIMLYPWEES